MHNIKVKSVDLINEAISQSREIIKPLKVLLIQPPTDQGVISLLPQMGDSDEGIGHKPPLGILSISTTILNYSVHKVQLIDCIAQKISIQDAVDKALIYVPHIIGISAWTDFWYPSYILGRSIKEKIPEAHLVYGGPHISIFPQETLSLPFVDSVIVGDGEVPFLFLCNMIANGKIDNQIPGLHFKEFGIKNDDSLYYIQKDLDKIPIPERTLLPLNLYSSVLCKSNYTTTMITSRGCPNKCTFCKLGFQKTTSRSASSVIKEFKYIYDLGIKEVEIYDDTFTWSKKRVIDICNGLIESKIKLKWAIRDRVNQTDPELLKLMNRAGCVRIHYGVESGVQKVLNRMKKNITIDQVRNAIKWSKKAHFTVLTYFMFGNLDETLEDMHRTIDFALELNTDYAEFSITIPYPGTEMYFEALETGLIKNDYWRLYAIGPTPNFRPSKLIENNVDLETLITVRNEAIKLFYFRVSYILRQIYSVRSCREFVRKTRMGFHLFLGIFRKRSNNL